MERLKDVKAHVHFIGILGSGCYPLARLLHSRGYTVTGSDACTRVESYTDDLGILISGRGGSVPEKVDLAVYSLAISEDDAEILSMRSRGTLLISRAQLLGALMSLYSVRISVSGSHGKSTTTAVIESILSAAGLAHTALSGATLATGSAYTDGGGDIFLAEACEYKDSFLSLCPTHQIITSVELDHTDYFPTEEAIFSSFLRAARMADTVIINADDPLAYAIKQRLEDEGLCPYTAKTQPHGAMEKRGLIDTYPPMAAENDSCAKKRILTFGRSSSADYRIHSIVHRGELTELALTFGETTLRLVTPLLGEFNLYNIAAAVTLADSLGIDSDVIPVAISDFRGIDRRLSLITDIRGVPVYYDYAHHPSEIRAVIRALKGRYGTLSVIFRPHTYSRTASLWDDFVTALGMADRLLIVDVYAARERPIPGIDSEHLAECIDGAIYVPDPSRSAQLATGQGIGAVVLLGAGEVDEIKADLIELGQQK